MSEELVAIAYEFSPLKANLIRSRLEADGIECFLAGETLTSVVGSLSYASASWQHPEGNIAIQVRASDVEAAKAILREAENAATNEEEEEEDELVFDQKPSLGLLLLRVFFVGCLAVALALLTYDVTEQRISGVVAGGSAFVAMSYLAFKKTFNLKR